MNKNNKIIYNGGAAMMILVIFFVFISVTILIGVVNPTIREYKIATDSFKSKQTYFLAESGIEDVIYRLRNSKKTTGTETLVLGDSQSVTTITSLGSNQKQISTLGDIDSHQRKIDVVLNTATGISFNYGVQVGQGGINLDGSSGINGNVYANGPIKGSTSSFISGTAISANSPAILADQANGIGTPTNNIVFGNANLTQDIAQSFKVQTSSPLNKVQFYIKKTSSPSDAIVKIMNDVNGNIGTIVLASGTLSASTITTSYGWVNVAFSTNPLLNVSTTYWLVIDASTSSTKYYTIGGTGNNTYTNGISKIGQLGGAWTTTNSNIIDYFFNLYLGGLTGLIEGTSESQYNQLSVGTSGTGTAQAHTVKYTEAPSLIYCQTGIGNNKSCTAQADPAYVAFPLSDANIIDWKSEATTGGTITGNYDVSGSNTSHLGPKKITGNLTVGGSGILYITGTVYVQGNVIVSGSGKIVLDSIYAKNSGVLVTDGYLNLGGSGQLNGTGQSGSYILFVTTSNCDVSFCAQNAIDISGSAGSVVLNAQNGTIGFTGSASAKEATAYKMSLSGSTKVNYESGLTNMNFNSGPSGTWSINSWKEVE
jgi:hypothetical protein